ncbi:MAG: glycosyltransferase [Chthoniobacterales bacterium]|nr:glycosyltransferase [Chthoniobacterales bacterium]
MRVLHVYRTYFPDQASGIAEAIRQICLATRPHGVGSTIFTLSPSPCSGRPPDPEAKVVRARSWAAPASCDLGGIQAFTRFRREARQADLIHYHFPWPFADILHLSTRPMAPAVMTWHSDVVRQATLVGFYTPVMNRMLRRMSLIAATSPAYAKTSTVLADPAVRNRVRVLPLGVDESSFHGDGDASVLQRLGLAGPFVLFLGAMRYYKGLDVLLEASKAIGAPVVLAGGGPELERLRGLARNSGRMIFAGEVSEVEKLALLKSCTALVLPSNKRSEAYGIVLVEAALCGKPMVTCEIGTGTSYVNLDGETGFVVEPDNAGALSRALNRLLEDPPLAAHLGQAARRRYEENFSGRVLGRAHMEFYREALEAQPPLSTGNRTAFQESLEDR